MSLAYDEIKGKVRQFIMQEEHTNFAEMAKMVFFYQYQQNSPYRKYCRKRRVHPTSIQDVTQIPPVPIQAFKETVLVCSPEEELERIFMTSGTTNPDKRGKNGHRDLEVYDLSATIFFKENMMPDVNNMKMVILFPAGKEMPHSSLAHYLQLMKNTFGTEDSEYVASEKGFDELRLKEILAEAENKDEPVFLLGATFSFIHFLDTCKEEKLTFSLPAGSRVMDTGGAKGTSREVDPLELKRQLSKLFSIPEYACGNMYGMTELSSQLYDQTLRLQGPKTLKKPPHWVKTTIVDPETMKEKPEGETGIIVHYDLANFHSVAAVMTEDLGVKEGDSLYLLGRAEGAEVRGCSLAMESFLQADQGTAP
ncbi:long-chain fatty acid--CoA ligase [Salicibibacter halophilus]|uniref:Long-chain fatty acid--CoA ligase n=1 Tax=Salicibibacter halophilus TaxID=2502791 RepID=A0A514LN58_9BACI|nr:long-chain fatty acid--CoA ligase [Salicibibacter halophilus]